MRGGKAVPGIDIGGRANGERAGAFDDERFDRLFAIKRDRRVREGDLCAEDGGVLRGGHGAGAPVSGRVPGVIPGGARPAAFAEHDDAIGVGRDVEDAAAVRARPRRAEAGRVRAERRRRRRRLEDAGGGDAAPCADRSPRRGVGAEVRGDGERGGAGVDERAENRDAEAVAFVRDFAENRRPRRRERDHLRFVPVVRSCGDDLRVPGRPAFQPRQRGDVLALRDVRAGSELNRLREVRGIRPVVGRDRRGIGRGGGAENPGDRCRVARGGSDGNGAKKRNVAPRVKKLLGADRREGRIVDGCVFGGDPGVGGAALAETHLVERPLERVFPESDVGADCEDAIAVDEGGRRPVCLVGAVQEDGHVAAVEDDAQMLPRPHPIVGEEVVGADRGGGTGTADVDAPRRISLEGNLPAGRVRVGRFRTDETVRSGILTRFVLKPGREREDVPLAGIGRRGDPLAAVRGVIPAAIRDQDAAPDLAFLAGRRADVRAVEGSAGRVRRRRRADGFVHMPHGEIARVRPDGAIGLACGKIVRLAPVEPDRSAGAQRRNAHPDERFPVRVPKRHFAGKDRAVLECEADVGSIFRGVVV